MSIKRPTLEFALTVRLTHPEKCILHPHTSMSLTPKFRKNTLPLLPAVVL